MKDLSYLDLADTYVEDITPVVNCPLVFISLLGAPVKDYAPLTRLPQLEWVRASDLSAEEVEIFGTLTNLKDLTLHNSPVSDLFTLYGLRRLSFLDLYNCKLTNIHGIDRFPELRGLCIAENPITDHNLETGFYNLYFRISICVQAAYLLAFLFCYSC